MDTQLQSLSKIFIQSLFRIPDYQRGYAWEEKQLKDFWNDINQLEAGKNHYIGVLTLEAVPEELYQKWEEDIWIIEAKSFKPFYIVDGQQRLTTSIVLIQVILEQVNSRGKLNYTSPLDIQKQFIFDSKDDGISRSYIFGYEQDNPSYEYLKTYIFGEHSTTAGDLKETIYTQNLEFAKTFFKKELEVLNYDELGNVYKKVTQKLLFNIFTIAEEVDVCVAFETMNNRGKPLSYLELLKNRLIYLSLKFQEPDSEKITLRRTINDCWKAIYYNLGRNKSQRLDDDEFLKAHSFLYFFSHDRDELENYRRNMRYHRLEYSKFLLENWFIQQNMSPDIRPKRQITLISVHDYVRSLQVCVETWYKLFNPKDTELDDDIKFWLGKINRLGMPSVATLILTFFVKEVSVQKRSKFLRVLERFIFIYKIEPRVLLNQTLESKTFHWIIMISKGIAVDKITSDINDESNKLKDSKYFEESLIKLSQKGFYKWSCIRYFLFEYNHYLQEKSKTKRSKILWAEFNENKQDFVTVEHIFPQIPDNKYWMDRFGHYEFELRKKLCDSLGNLLPLSKPKNSSLSNKPFPDKVAGEESSYIGYRYGCYAENEVSGFNEWTPQIILDRGLKLLDFMEERWDIPLGNKIQRLSLLGLEDLDGLIIGEEK